MVSYIYNEYDKVFIFYNNNIFITQISVVGNGYININHYFELLGMQWIN